MTSYSNPFEHQASPPAARTAGNEISAEGLDAHWMAYSGNRQFKKDPRILVGADGIYYIDDRGRRIMDGLSGLWTCGLGSQPAGDRRRRESAAAHPRLHTGLPVRPAEVLPARRTVRT
jgi:4-aminobutyrate aminotransferase-like enzyme